MSLKRKPSKMFWISLLIPLLVLISMLIKPVSTMVKGEEITLATIPVDPRDLFYGDYVTLDLEIEEIDVSLIEPSIKRKLDQYEYQRKQTVFVSLREGEEGIFEAVSVGEEKPNGLYIKGKMSPFIQDNSWNEEAETKKSVFIDYGIERYYVEEGTGLELENQANQGQVLVSVKIYNGYPLLTDLKSVK
ncbi:GDYXXLXY domain-containing protein [Metabacillus litoralis]|uniref:GDYXXLXY domain-containing protein n=1 Tax=Metabacillus litoralis TaxID=152268 RepID=UPI001CFD46F0|nr:GDYXXLXY domain-containing protein [Metabacillus litoralis]